MAAARYWRIVSLDSYGGASLQLSEFGLFDGATRRDVGSVVTSTVAPASGALSALNDEGFGTEVTFDATQFRLPGFAIAWDLAAAVEVNRVRLATISNSTAPMNFTVQYQDGGGQWVTERTVRGAKPSTGALGQNIDLVDDLFYPSVQLLLAADGSNGSTSFSDLSAFSRVVTAVGAAQVSTAQSKFGGSSIYLDGVGDYLTVSQIAFGTGDFTIEMWYRQTARLSTYPCLWSNYNSYTSGGIALYAGHLGGVTNRFQVAVGALGFPAIQSTVSITPGIWQHVALVRESGTLRLFIDGVLNGSASLTGVSLNGVGPLQYIGSTGDAISDSSVNGYVDDLRITRGVARYAANFTPPTARFFDGVDTGSGDPMPIRAGAIGPVRSISYYRVPDPALFSTRAPQSLDQEDSGRLRIYGTVKNAGTPKIAVHRRVRLHEQRSGRVVREQWSNPVTGAFSFDYIVPGTYYVTTFDHTGQYNGEVATDLIAEPMS